ncbi:hypothetical protein QBC46DRAFT_274799 [Diplogelasinospora grovesii]|uniref:MACPF domain-containing protein n=1 Tax=Diplogelasinospora grovesii TaxID=303347 RepID=A0AAN6MW41_9PEZI|nr:hypothetical protein QBC46DRAFT_274799 [Diplogelasinospora grovesii]
MGLVEDFPRDPFTPSLRYAATCQTPITLPWGREFISLGTSLSVSREDGVKSKFLDKSLSAFSQTSLQRSRLVLESASGGDTSTAESTGVASSREHLDCSITGQIGGSFIGAKGRANYETSAANDASDVKFSFRTTYRGGMVRFLQEPAFSDEAVDLLRSSNDGRAAQQAFRDKYGEYYVAAYILGGSNATLMGGMAASAASSRDLTGSFTVTAFWVSKTKTFEEHERNATATAAATMAGYDSLQGCDEKQEAKDPTSYSNLMQFAGDNKGRGWRLAGRVEAKTAEMGLGAGGRSCISWGKCDEICREGLVVELLLLPYSGLRQYVEAFLGV